MCTIIYKDQGNEFSLSLHDYTDDHCLLKYSLYSFIFKYYCMQKLYTMDVETSFHV